MPNHVTTNMKAPSHVIQALINEEERIDFGKIIPFTGSFDWDGISGDAETLAEKVVGMPFSENPLLGSLQHASRERVQLGSLPDESFEQFIQMLRNHRATGFFHSMDFAREMWGTKWNAYDASIDLNAGSARFDTAWSFPEPVIVKLSELFPDDEIAIEYADEDIGSNCGKLLIKGGKIIESDIAGNWNNQSEEERSRWTAFAYQVKGWEPDEEDE